MFQFLSRWAWRRRRALFTFFDGHRIRRADPLRVLLALREHPRFELGTHPKQMAAGDEEARSITVEAVRDVLHLPPLSDDGDGLTDAEALAVLAEFFEYLARQKKSIELPRSLPRSMAPQSSETSTTKCDSDCGSTSTSADTASPPP